MLSMEIFALLSGSGLMFFIWHMWRYDNFRCLIPTRQDWFRAMMCYLMLISVCSLFTYGVIQMYVLYDQYFATIKGVTLPKKWQTWPEDKQKLWRDSLYILTVGWATMQAVHLEEFLYWAYLMSSIRLVGGPKVSWLRSPYFKVWIGGTLSGLVLLVGAVNIEKHDLDAMRAYLFLVGGAMSTVLATFSTALCFAFPSFVRAVRSQGASYDVIDRLAFFQEMNSIRTVFRWIYSLCFVILSADGLSTKKTINSSSFASDIVFMTGIVAVLITACLSVILLLPRNMSAEALPSSAQPAKMRMVAYPRPRSHSANPHLGARSREGAVSHADQLAILGQRLNLDREAMGGMTDDLLEQPPVPPKAPASSNGDMDGESVNTGYKASQSEENIFGNEAPVDHLDYEEKKPKKGVRWSATPSNKDLEKERAMRRAEAPSIPMSPPGTGRRPSQVWVHTETTQKQT